MIYGYEEVFICQQKIISFDLLMKKKQRNYKKIGKDMENLKYYLELWFL